MNKEVQDFFSGKPVNLNASPAPVGEAEVKANNEVKRVFDKIKAVKAKKTVAPLITPDEVVPRTRMERYEDELKTFNLSLDSAHEIVDAIITNFFWEELVPITKSLSVVLRTRTQKAQDNLNIALEKVKTQTDQAYFTELAKHNLASSLVRYGEYEFNPDEDESYNTSVDFVRRLPTPLFALLIDKLSWFDRKMATVMKEGCIENF